MIIIILSVGFDTVNRLNDGEARVRILDGSVPKRFILVLGTNRPQATDIEGKSTES
jgi:hypothetical protein